MSGTNYSSSNYTIFHKRWSKRHSYGIYKWIRWGKNWDTKVGVGYVIRIGPLGHLQFQWCYRSIPGNGRRPRLEIAVHWWGIAGRRRKRGFGVFRYL